MNEQFSNSSTIVAPLPFKFVLPSETFLTQSLQRTDIGCVMTRVSCRSDSHERRTWQDLSLYSYASSFQQHHHRHHLHHSTVRAPCPGTTGRKFADDVRHCHLEERSLCTKRASKTTCFALLLITEHDEEMNYHKVGTTREALGGNEQPHVSKIEGTYFVCFVVTKGYGNDDRSRSRQRGVW